MNLKLNRDGKPIGMALLPSSKPERELCKQCKIDLPPVSDGEFCSDDCSIKHDKASAAKDRTSKAAEALKPYAEIMETWTAVVDLLTDLRHFCDVHDLDFDSLDELAYGHYSEETAAA